MNWLRETLTAAAAALGLLGAPGAPVVHGYVEGEYLRIAAPEAGRLETLAVTRGDRVVPGQPLFALDTATARAERDRLAAALAQARADLADLVTGKRPAEVRVIDEQRRQAEASLRYSEADLKRQQALAQRGVAAAEALDAARAAFRRDTARLAELEAELEVAALPARPERIRAAEQAVAMAEAALARQDRLLADLAPPAPAAARVEDTLYRAGEWVPAGAPVVSLLPPGAVKIVAFVPEPWVAAVRPGDRVGVRCDGCPADLAARVVFVASEAEYTPPVIYSVGSREKLVFRIEAQPDAAAGLNPGLPVDLVLGGGAP
ncbi:HlyD family secretion protein [Azospirillum sp. ST 5-10]|uniref:HlyD family secretion protein n=1 Tax=unclassified Azospirillum TaxID=2630922 RepID=UPI003F49B600